MIAHAAGGSAEARALSDIPSKPAATLADMLMELDDKELPSEDMERTPTDRELDLYASLPCISSAVDPLVWWSQHQNTFPNLAILAKKYLCVQATSVASERLSSAAGNIVTTKRNYLKPSKVNMLCFLATNI